MSNETDPATCLHTYVEGDATASSSMGDGEVRIWQGHIRFRCAVCGKPFTFAVPGHREGYDEHRWFWDVGVKLTPVEASAPAVSRMREAERTMARFEGQPGGVFPTALPPGDDLDEFEPYDPSRSDGSMLVATVAIVVFAMVVGTLTLIGAGTVIGWVV